MPIRLVDHGSPQFACEDEERPDSREDRERASVRNRITWWRRRKRRDNEDARETISSPVAGDVEVRASITGLGAEPFVGMKQPLTATLGPGDVKPTAGVPARVATFDYNVYAQKKSTASGLMDLALLMANASQLKYVLAAGTRHQFYYAMLALIIGSIVLQVCIGAALMFLTRARVHGACTTEDELSSTRRANRINNAVIFSILVLTVLNVFISSFGLDDSGSWILPKQ